MAGSTIQSYDGVCRAVLHTPAKPGLLNEMCGLHFLHKKTEHWSLKFTLKCTTHTGMKNMFPLNPSIDTHNMRRKEKFMVNRARTEKSCIREPPNLATDAIKAPILFFPLWAPKGLVLFTFFSLSFFQGGGGELLLQLQCL